MKKTEMMVKVKDLTHAEWNPRTPAELAWDHPEMASLIESVRAVGVIQPIAVWGDLSAVPVNGNAVGVVIAGNRRLEAAKAAGLDEIPALVFTGISEAQARMITRIENEVRLGVDPLKDASLIGSMIGLGYSQKEIAAHFGVSEARICRRRKLLDLIPEMRETGGKVTADALEHIALYPREIQLKCMASVMNQARGDGAPPVRWGSISHLFARETCDLAGASFDCGECKACSKRTGAQPDLWGETPEDESLGQCLDKECFSRRTREAALADLRKKVGKRGELIDGEAAGIANTWNTPEGFTTGERDAEHPACWYWFSYCDSVEYRFGPKLKDYEKQQAQREAKAEREAEEYAAHEAERKAEEERQRAIENERDKFKSAVEKKQEEIAQTVTTFLTGLGGESLGREYIANELFKFVKTAPQRNALAALFFGIVDSGYGFEDDIANICEAFPKFAAKCGVTTADLNAYGKAKTDLMDFEMALAE